MITRGMYCTILYKFGEQKNMLPSFKKRGPVRPKIFQHLTNEKLSYPFCINTKFIHLLVCSCCHFLAFSCSLSSVIPVPGARNAHKVKVPYQVGRLLKDNKTKQHEGGPWHAPSSKFISGIH
jgi:hypothetical protein